ncbi:heterokaryon incompatibility Het-C [Trichoderma aethiopicum]
MASFSPSRGTWLLVFCICLVLLPSPVAAFGAGNIPSIAQVEGHNWRHGDIEDMLSGIAFLHGKKWTSMLIKRTYFGNWLRDYSQAVDVGSLKGVNAPTIRILVWVLSFMSFGYATEEFEVTEERLGCYRPEEHIDNPKGYADGIDARTLDPRLRGPVDPIEIDIDLNTGMKNYIANETGRWATSAGYLRYSFARSIHFGRLYTSGPQRGNEADLCEALRCLGQALHCMEDFSAHSNYCELALRELGHRDVFPHCGAQSEITVRGKRIFPLVTGTFGGVDFLHSVIGEANDHFTQSEVDEVDIALLNAGAGTKSGGGGASRGLLDIVAPKDFISLIAKIPGDGSGFAAQARELKAMSEAQERENETRSRAGGNANVVPGMSPNFDPVKTARQIYPILQFRDRIVKAISRGIEKVPGLEKLLEHISETLTAFILGLLAPFIRPIINQVSKVLKDGSSGVISASANSQFEPWENPRSSDPTHSMLSKDHFTNVLNPCAGRIAATILQYTVPRVLYAWENPSVPVDEVVNDVLRAFHHPALRNDHVQIQRDMFRTVQDWVNEHPRRHEIDRLLSSESVKHGKNHILNQKKKGGVSGHAHDAWDTVTQLGHGKVSGSLWEQVKTRDLNSMEGHDGNPALNYTSSSPAPPSRYSPPAHGGYGYGESASYVSQSQAESSHGQSGHASSYYQGHHNQSQQPSQGYGSHQPQYQQPQYGQPSYQQPQYGSEGQWAQGQQPHGYGGPAQPQYASHQGHHQQSPSYGSQYHGSQHHEQRHGY